MSIPDITSMPSAGVPAALLFYAPWHEASCEGGEIDSVFRTLSTMFTPSQLSFGRVEAEAVPDLSSRLGVTVVPTLCLLDASGNLVERIDGCDDASQITQAVRRLANEAGETAVPKAATDSAPPTEEETLIKRLNRLVRSADVMLFMKGTPNAPRCGFSRQAVEILTNAGISFGSFNILTDETVRQGLKTFSDWPTYPQLYVNGELVGGLDILKEMNEEGEDLKEQLGIVSSAQPPPASLDDRLAALIKRHRIMLFMKGLPSAPRCGFSRQMVELLEKHNATYDTFDILQDEEVRQGLKKYSDWPTYPQLYVDGDLIGGLDIVKEMEDSGGLEDLVRG